MLGQHLRLGCQEFAEVFALSQSISPNQIDSFGDEKTEGTYTIRSLICRPRGTFHGVSQRHANCLGAFEDLDYAPLAHASFRGITNKEDLRSSSKLTEAPPVSVIVVPFTMVRLLVTVIDCE